MLLIYIAVQTSGPHMAVLLWKVIGLVNEWLGPVSSLAFCSLTFSFPPYHVRGSNIHCHLQAVALSYPLCCDRLHPLYINISLSSCMEYVVFFILVSISHGILLCEHATFFCYKAESSRPTLLPKERKGILLLWPWYFSSFINWLEEQNILFTYFYFHQESCSLPNLTQHPLIAGLSRVICVSWYKSHLFQILAWESINSLKLYYIL